MSTVTINSENVLKAFKNADGKGQQLLKDLVNGQVDFNMSIIDRTPTVEAALEIAGTSLSALSRSGDAKHEFAARVIETVIAVLNEGVKVDHSNSDQVKYEPRFYYEAGRGLSYFIYHYWNTVTCCCPRLCYLSYDKLKHGITILDKYYNDYLN